MKKKRTGTTKWPTKNYHHHQSSEYQGEREAVAPVGAEPEGLSRQKEICETVRQAMNDLAKKREVNWMREGAEVEQAAVGLSAAMVDYVEGKGSKGNVRSAYKQYINTLEGTDGNAGGS